MALRAVKHDQTPEAGLEKPRWVAARDQWDERYGNLARGKHNWQLFALAMLALNALLCVALFYLASQTKITPYVVEVDKIGQAVAFGPAEQLKEPAERLYRYQLAILVYNIRAVLADTQAQLMNIKRAYSYVGGDAQVFLDSYFRANNPLERVKTETVTVQVTSVLRLSPTTWQVQWREIHNGTIGTRPTDEHWQAAITTQLTPPTDSEKILENPLGLYATSINWTRTNQ